MLRTLGFHGLHHSKRSQYGRALALISSRIIGDMQAEDLIQEAREAARNADAPYSNFPVGAALETADGRLFHGCNVESASYGLTMCAERTAIFFEIGAGARPVRIAVTCVHGDPSVPATLMPCGACRQVMMDKMGPEGTVLVDGVGEFTVADLLPHGFHLPRDPGIPQ
jgi:cytidine deaminase